MKNEEKAKELSERGFKDLNNPYIRVTVSHIKGCCLEMAQWKDEQLAKCIENLEKEYIRNSGKGLYDNNEIAAKLATLKRIEEEMNLSKIHN